MTDTKYCKPCDRDLPRSKFGDNAARRDGKQSQCLTCRAAKARVSRRLAKARLR